MRLAQNDEMIDTLAPDGSDQPFGKAILPRMPMAPNRRFVMVP